MSFKEQNKGVAVKSRYLSGGKSSTKTKTKTKTAMPVKTKPERDTFDLNTNRNIAQSKAANKQSKGQTPSFQPNNTKGPRKSDDKCKPNQFSESDSDLECGETDLGGDKERISKLLNRMTSDAHLEAKRDIDEQIQSLRDRITQNRRLLNATTQSVNSIKLSHEREQADKCKSNCYNLLSSLDSRQWSKNLDEVSLEIERTKGILEKGNWEQATSNIKKFHNVLQESVNTIKKMSSSRVNRQPADSGEMMGLLQEIHARTYQAGATNDPK